MTSANKPVLKYYPLSWYLNEVNDHQNVCGSCLPCWNRPTLLSGQSGFNLAGTTVLAQVITIPSALNHMRYLFSNAIIINCYIEYIVLLGHGGYIQESQGCLPPALHLCMDHFIYIYIYIYFIGCGSQQIHDKYVRKASACNYKLDKLLPINIRYRKMLYKRNTRQIFNLRIYMPLFVNQWQSRIQNNTYQINQIQITYDIACRVNLCI